MIILPPYANIGVVKAAYNMRHTAHITSENAE